MVSEGASHLTKESTMETFTSHPVMLEDADLDYVTGGGGIGEFENSVNSGNNSFNNSFNDADINIGLWIDIGDFGHISVGQVI
jgi:hypothetical protein